MCQWQTKYLEPVYWIHQRIWQFLRKLWSWSRWRILLSQHPCLISAEHEIGWTVSFIKPSVPTGMSCLYQDMNSSSPVEWKALHLEVLPETVFGDTTKPHKVWIIFKHIGTAKRGVKGTLNIYRDRSLVFYITSLMFYIDPFLYMTQGNYEIKKA